MKNGDWITPFWVDDAELSELESLGDRACRMLVRKSNTNSWDDNLERFLSVLSPIVGAVKLDAVLFTQFGSMCPKMTVAPMNMGIYIIDVGADYSDLGCSTSPNSLNRYYIVGNEINGNTFSQPLLYDTPWYDLSHFIDMRQRLYESITYACCSQGALLGVFNQPYNRKISAGMGDENKYPMHSKSATAVKLPQFDSVDELNMKVGLGMSRQIEFKVVD